MTHTHNTLFVKEAEKEIGNLSEFERNFFVYLEEFNRLSFGKIEGIRSSGLPIIRSDCLNWLLYKLSGDSFDSQAIIHIIGIQIQGDVICDQIEFLKSLCFIECSFSEDVVFFQCTFRNLVFEKTVFRKKIHAENIVIKNNFIVRESHLQEQLDIGHGHIGGSLIFEDTLLGKVQSQKAIHANSIRIDGNITFTEKVRINGSVLFESSIIKGSFTCFNADFSAYETCALSLDNSRIDGYLKIGHSNIMGEASLSCAKIGADIIIKESSFKNNSKCTINASSVQVVGNIKCIDFKSNGFILLWDARIDGILEFTQETKLINHNGYSLHSARICSRGIYMHSGFMTDGEISLHEANIDGSLICRGGKFLDDISGDNMFIKGDIFLDAQSPEAAHFQSVSTVFLRNVNIHGSLICRGGEFKNLHAPNITVKGNIELTGWESKTFSCTGTVCLDNATISGNLDCDRSCFRSWPNEALMAEHISVKNIFIFRTYIDGMIRFYNAKIDGVLRIEEALWHDRSRLDLAQVNTKVLLENKDSWPSKGNLYLQGFVYEHIDSRVSLKRNNLTAKEAIDWLNLVPEKEFHPQPYEMLAITFKKLGLEEEAQEIQIKKNELLDRKEKQKLIDMLELEDEYNSCEFSSEIINSKPQICKSHTELSNCIFYLFKRLFFGTAIGYGYRVKRLLPIFIYLFLSSSCFFYWASNGNHNIMTSAQKSLRSNKSVYSSSLPGTPEWLEKHNEENDHTLSQIISDDYPHFQPVVYSLDVIVPLVDLGQEEYWMPNHNNYWGKWAYFFVVFLKLSGWGISTLLVYAVTGLIRR